MRAIDVRHLGREKVICCWEVDGVLIDPGPQAAEAVLLEQLGDLRPRAILLTHIHLDHAGATGSLVRRWPEVPVYVHEHGAAHLVDPSKLVASASRLYPDMDERWGAIVPVPEENVHAIGDGDTVLGDCRVAYTPGHASHHVSFLHEPTGTALVGDVAGCRIADGPILPPTPPPDVDLEAWHASLRTVASWSPERIAITHFGTWDDVAEHLGTMHEELDRWAEVSRRTDEDSYAAAIEEEMRTKTSDPDFAEAFIRAMPPKMLWAGWERYFASREKAAD